MAETHDGSYSSVGIHPHDARNCNEPAFESPSLLRLAEIKSEDPEKLSEVIWENTWLYRVDAGCSMRDKSGKRPFQDGNYLDMRWAMAFSNPSMVSSNMGKISPITCMVRV